jgi:UDP-N-acetylglucosamine--N-acetylmuramyl-(pentapeptide) pyrophosphoryl-undecaprenol N-acetylglucosamine transferase
VSAAAVNLAETTKYFRNARVTGTPVRPEFFAIAPKPVAPAGRLLVFGASQGARVLNETLPKIIERLLVTFPGLTVVHQTGARHIESTLAAYERLAVQSERLRVTAYLDDMAAQFAEADLVVCRSGASSVAEVAAAGRAAVLIPFPQAADDHQRKNAEAFVAAGAAELIIESQLTEELLLSTLRVLLGDDVRRADMGKKARELAHPQAVREIAGLAVSLAR